METNIDNPIFGLLVSSIFLLCSLVRICDGVDIIRHGQTVRDGNTLVSEAEIFELGFFSPENSILRFLGIWFSSNNTATILQNSGNFVLSSNESIGDTNEVHWQSFNHPTDTFLLGMRVPVNSAMGEYSAFTAWKSTNNPSSGSYTVGVDPHGGPQIIIWDHMKRRWRSGQWNSVIFTGVSNMSNIASFLYRFKLSQPNENRTQYFTYNPLNPSDLLRFRVGWDGMEHQSCLGNCSCNAYAFVSGIGCMMWTEDLVDISHLDQSGSLEFFYRLHHYKLGLPAISSIPCCKDNDIAVLVQSKSKSKELSTDLSVSSIILIDGNQVNRPELPIFNLGSLAAATNNFSKGNRLGLRGFGAIYKVVIFVYAYQQGELPGGQEIVVKKLSTKSCQGLEELKNEIILIAKLHYRNLVRLLGCSIQGDEKMLIYEYMPNKSLDYFLFNEARKEKLDWRTCLRIIEGIARGLFYLHRDSRLRIIHRDLKASNILLDGEMNPKVSDFRMARIFRGNQHEANTVRVVETYGYMSPEYAMEGLFSVKSDVYSFGVLLLEIIYGRRNTSFRSIEHTSLITYAWDLWNEEKAMDLIDPSIRDSCSLKEMLKCIHIGMLCVQDSVMHRPTMAAVMLLLESETPTLPMPRQPSYASMRSSINANFISDGQEIVSSNNLTVTMVVGR
ncbi:hypothetical protein ES332_D09G088300v1 [Gossypium tomentosum]|nr:hypothetical protein ES332_D09G088300v1 [Gossypium tomentosum]